MKIIIDGDACPVIPNTLTIAYENKIEVLIVSDFNHDLDYEYATCICVSQGNDSSDHKIFELCNKGDIVITSDGGLANLILGKQGIPISFDGFIYTLENIDAVLMQRYLNAKERKESKRFKHIAKRTSANDMQFESSLLFQIHKTISI